MELKPKNITSGGSRNVGRSTRPVVPAAPLGQKGLQEDHLTLTLKNGKLKDHDSATDGLLCLCEGLILCPWI
jgi:hypothetical protein